MKDYISHWTTLLLPWLFTHGLKILMIAFATFILHKVLHKFIEKAVRLVVSPAGFSSKEAETKRENTLINIFNATSIILLFTISGLMILQEGGLNVTPILAGAGIVGLAFGFGGQFLIRDIISGLFIIMENQYRIGDVVNFDNVGGLVENITLRMTTLRDLDGTVHHVPHGEIKTVSNLSKYFARVNMNIGVAYDSDLEHVIRVINQVGKELAEDLNWKQHITLAPQFLRVDEFADSSIIVKILGETKPLKQWDVAGELRKRIKVAFDKESIEIPFPQRVVHLAK